MKSKTYLLTLVMALVSMAALADCTPSFHYVPEVEVRVSSIWHVGMHALLIGCDEEIRSMTEGEQQRARAGVADLVKENGIFLEVSLEDQKFRKESAARVNRAIGREIFSEVFGFKFTFTEYRPTDE